MLGDEPFPSALERVLVQRAAVAANDVADPQERRPGLCEQALERRAALEQRPIAQVGAAVAQHVERDERDVGCRRARLTRAAEAGGWTGWTLLRGGDIQQVDATLQLLKSGRLALRVEGDDLAVEHERFRALARPLSERGGDLGKLARLLVAEPRPQPDDAAWLDLRDRADAVVFRFVDEVRVVERRVGERRQHRLQHGIHVGYELAALELAVRTIALVASAAAVAA